RRCLGVPPRHAVPGHGVPARREGIAAGRRRRQRPPRAPWMERRDRVGSSEVRRRRLSTAEVSHLDVLSELVRDGDVGLTDQERASLRWAITSLAPPVDHEIAEKAAKLKREYRT